MVMFITTILDLALTQRCPSQCHRHLSGVFKRTVYAYWNSQLCTYILIACRLNRFYRCISCQFIGISSFPQFLHQNSFIHSDPIKLTIGWPQLVGCASWFILSPVPCIATINRRVPGIKSRSQLSWQHRLGHHFASCNQADTVVYFSCWFLYIGVSPNPLQTTFFGSSHLVETVTTGDSGDRVSYPGSLFHSWDVFPVMVYSSPVKKTPWRMTLMFALMFAKKSLFRIQWFISFQINIA